MPRLTHVSTAAGGREDSDTVSRSATDAESPVSTAAGGREDSDRRASAMPLRRGESFNGCWRPRRFRRNSRRAAPAWHVAVSTAAGGREDSDKSTRVWRAAFLTVSTAAGGREDSDQQRLFEPSAEIQVSTAAGGRENLDSHESPRSLRLRAKFQRLLEAAKIQTSWPITIGSGQTDSFNGCWRPRRFRHLMGKRRIVVIEGLTAAGGREDSDRDSDVTSRQPYHGFQRLLEAAKNSDLSDSLKVVQRIVRSFNGCWRPRRFRRDANRDDARQQRVAHSAVSTAAGGREDSDRQTASFLLHDLGCFNGCWRPRRFRPCASCRSARFRSRYNGCWRPRRIQTPWQTFPIRRARSTVRCFQRLLEATKIQTSPASLDNRTAAGGREDSDNCEHVLKEPFP